MNMLQRIRLSVARRNDEVFVREDFARFGSPAQVSRTINKLLEEGLLVRLGLGVYAKAKKSALSGKPIPVRPLEILAPLALEKLGVRASPSRYVRSYNRGETTQLPAGVVVNTGNQKVSRRIGFGGRFIKYENNLS